MRKMFALIAAIVGVTTGCSFTNNYDDVRMVRNAFRTEQTQNWREQVKASKTRSLCELRTDFATKTEAIDIIFRLLHKIT